jgi:outer membrane protein
VIDAAQEFSMIKKLMISMLVLGSGGLGMSAIANAQTPAQNPSPTAPTAPVMQAPAAAPAPQSPAADPGGPPNKIGVIVLGQALLATKEGQKAAGEINTKFAPKKAEFDKREAEIASLTDQLRKSSATMSDDARTKLQREIDVKTKVHQRESQTAEEDMQADEQKIMQDLQGKMQQIVAAYGSQNGFAVIMDVNSQSSAVFWASQAADITPEMIKLYDQAHPVAAAPSAPGAKPAGQPPLSPPKQ